MRNLNGTLIFRKFAQILQFSKFRMTISNFNKQNLTRNVQNRFRFIIKPTSNIKLSF